MTIRIASEQIGAIWLEDYVAILQTRFAEFRTSNQSIPNIQETPGPKIRRICARSGIWSPSSGFIVLCGPSVMTLVEWLIIDEGVHCVEQTKIRVLTVAIYISRNRTCT